MHGAFAEKVTTAWMQEVEYRMEQLPRMRGYKIRQLHLFYPLSPALPEGEGVNRTAVGTHCLFVITVYRQMKK